MSAPPGPPSPGISYRLLSLPLYLFWILHGLRHGYQHGLGQYLWMRMFGSDRGNPRTVWVHAASVGEVRAVSPLVRALLQRDQTVLFTSFTATGFRAIRHQFGDTVASDVIPFDSYWHCRRFFRRYQVGLGLIMETELWPELLYQARRHDVDLLLVNARLSRKSIEAGSFIRGLLSTTLGYFSRILARGERDRDALLSLGASPNRVILGGNLKTHIEPVPQPERLIDRDYLILASSHDGEEQWFLEARPANYADLLLVLAPRHPARSAGIRTLLEGFGLRYAVRSEAQPINDDTEVYLADTLGELGTLMAYARVVIMGGSFDNTGGHNLIEPASLGRAIITGPSDANIVDDIAMLVVGNGVLQVDSMAQCWRSVVELLEDPERAAALGHAARSRLAQQPDVVAQYMRVIEPYL